MELLASFFASTGNLVVGTLLPFFCVLLVVVFVHEMGHYLVGRWCGIGVRAFAVGFGPELLGFTDKHGTRWKLCAIPLGGYVKFVGDVGASSKPDSEGLLELSGAERKTAFQVQALWKKAATIIAGPVANFILAIAILTVFFAFAGKTLIAPVVGGVEPNSPAAEAGLQPGDRFLTVGGKETQTFVDVQHIVTARAGDPIDFTLDRNGTVIALTMTPKLVERTDDLGNKVKLGLVGVSADNSEANFKRITLGPLQAFGEAVSETGRTIERTLIFLKRFISGREDRCQMGGPVKIAEMAGQAAEKGLNWLITLTAFLSIGIGIMNLMPVPPLDGGHLMLYGFEAVLRRPLPAKLQELIYQAGFFAVMALIGFVLWNDLVAC
ncbi:MAG: RIP metalloprotease RseP [Notoacmeibacter sp.]